MLRSIDFLYRALQGNKQKDIAAKLGVTEGAISAWKKRNHVSPEHAIQLAALTGDDPFLASTVATLEQVKDDTQRSKLVQAIAKVREGFRWPLNAPKLGISMAS